MPIVHSGRQKGGAKLRSAAACAEAETPAQVGTSPSYSAAWQGFASGHGTTVWNYVEIGADATLDARTECAMLTNADDTLFPFSLPSVGKKKVTAAFDAGQISSDGGVLLLTVFSGVIMAVAIGMIIAAFIFMKKVADISEQQTTISPLADETWADERDLAPGDRDRLLVKHVEGPLFFGFARDFARTIAGWQPLPTKPPRTRRSVRR
jgi:hypothetical protein